MSARAARLRAPALAALSGVLYFLAFPGFDLWPLAFICLVPLHLALAEAETTRRTLALGLGMGFITNWGGYYWLVGMLEDFSGFPLPLCILFASVLCVYQAGAFVAYAFLYRAGRRARMPLLVVAPAALVLVEFTYPLLFPSYTANCLHRAIVLLQVADLFGPLGVTAMLALANAAVTEAWVRRGEGARTIARVLAPAALVVAAVVAYGFVRIEQVKAVAAASPALRVGIAQSNMGIYQKHEEPEEGLQRHRTLSTGLVEDGVDLLVWPESAYVYVLPERVRSVRRGVLGGLPGPLLFGGVQRRGEKLYNTAVLTDAEGRIVDTYDKVYLLAFGEYLPFGETFPILYDWSPHSGHFTAGTDLEPLQFGRFRIAALVCYEDILPRFVHDLARRGDPHLLVNMTNDAWFGKTHEPEIHLALSVLRSVEHRRWLVRATNTGVSAFVDPTGKVVARSGVFEQAALRAEVRMMRPWTLYGMVGDALGWASLAGWVVVYVRGRRARGAQGSTGKKAR